MLVICGIVITTSLQNGNRVTPASPATAPANGSRPARLGEAHANRDEGREASNRQPLEYLGNIVKDSFGSNGRDWMVGRLEFRDGLVAVASREGVTPMAVAARLIASARSEDERDNIIVAVRDCFRGLEWDIALAKELPAGRQRSRIVNGRAIGLAQQDRDLVGLKTLYDSIPVGADRANVAALGANLTVSLDGLPAALDYIAALEMPEERFAAFRVINTKANFAGYATDTEVQEKCDAIVESFPPQQRETYRYLRGKQR